MLLQVYFVFLEKLRMWLKFFIEVIKCCVDREIFCKKAARFSLGVLEIVDITKVITKSKEQASEKKSHPSEVFIYFLFRKS